jgi:NADH dehydrogenase FAD-containing subunit
MTRIVLLGGGFAGVEAIRGLERELGHRADIEILLVSDRIRKPMQVALDWGLARHFPRDSTIIRPPSRCPICGQAARVQERDVA